MKKLLINLNACQEGIDWAGDKTWEEVYNTCERGDWLLWLYAKTTDLTIESNLRLITLAKGLCANTARHLMQDKRSIQAVDIAIAYGEGTATRKELVAAAAAAYTAYAAYADDASTAYTAYAYTASASASASAAKANQKETANIVRNVIPIEKFNIN